MANTIIIDDISIDELQLISGVNNIFLKMIQDYFETEVVLINSEFYVKNPAYTDSVKRVLLVMLDEIRNNQILKTGDIIYICNLVKQNKENLYSQLRKKVFAKTKSGKNVFPKTIGQRGFVEDMLLKDIIFAVGPAGTGKTFLSVAYAADLLKNKKIKKIILTRPAVEAGENLGFLPGDLKEKVDPYLIPLYDALHEMLGVENVEKYIENGVIEIAPLAYMRGRTLNDAFIILDEAQNATQTQIKMFLTRLGFNSKMVINGDITQIDLKNQRDSGLASAFNLLKDIPDIAFVELSSNDVVRHPLVQKIIDAYEK